MSTRKDRRRNPVGKHGGRGWQEGIERRGARRRRGRLAILFAHRLSRPGRRRARWGRAPPAWPLCDVLDWRGSSSDRRGPRRGAWISRALEAALLRSGLSRFAGGIGLGGAVDSVDAVSSRGGATPTKTGGPARPGNVW